VRKGEGRRRQIGKCLEEFGILICFVSPETIIT
jgi:hypothetical protein